MSLKNDRLVFDKGRKDNKINIPLVLESPNASKNEKEEIDEMDFTIPSMLIG